jgi:hypothetical protein
MFIPQINYEQSQRDRQFTHTQNSSATPKHGVRLLGKVCAARVVYIKVQAGVLYLWLLNCAGAKHETNPVGGLLG